jgi:hypothetical protein
MHMDSGHMVAARRFAGSLRRRRPVRAGPSLATCRNGILPTSMPAWIRAGAEARPRQGRHRRDPSRAAGRARWPPRPSAAAPAGWARRSSPTRRWRNCSAASSPMPAWSIPATPPTRSAPSFYGDTQEKMTDASAHLLFFALELNRSTMRRSKARSPAIPLRPLPALGRRSAQGQALPARGPRSSSSSTRSRSPGAAPGTGCSTRPSPRCASTSTARS